LANGQSSPGVFLLRDEPLMRIAEYLILIAFATDPVEWRDRVTFIP
jgi:hypothetical protein